LEGTENKWNGGTDSNSKTPGVGWFLSGVANQAKWGLEIGGIAAIDIDKHTAFHLEAAQTLNADEQTLTELTRLSYQVCI